MLKIAFDKTYIYPLEKNHRFPMIKYELIPEQLLREGTCVDDNFFIPKQISDEDALLTHQSDYFERLVSLSLTTQQFSCCNVPSIHQFFQSQPYV